MHAACAGAAWWDAIFHTNRAVSTPAGYKEAGAHL